ncbi:MAG: aldo/keto reductase, partial [Planctomycetales bacterium]|nr:aldo/keto reductase [Planctomycetales bacterium]
CLDNGVNFLDTAYCYGVDGESERLVGETLLRDHRDEFVVATKCGIHWDGEGQRVIDGRPEVLKHECLISLQRLQADHVDVLYLHAPDPHVPIAESAGALRRIQESGRAVTIGASNMTIDQLAQFHAECPLTVVQPPFNMLQRQIEGDLLPWCRERGISVVIYWPLMKGLLAGKIARNHVFDRDDGRAKYPMFQGEEFQRNQDFVDALRTVAQRREKTVAQVVINWTIHQPGITAALCGAKRAYQIDETAAAMGWQLDEQDLADIAGAIDARGIPVTRAAV